MKTIFFCITEASWSSFREVWPSWNVFRKDGTSIEKAQKSFSLNRPFSLSYFQEIISTCHFSCLSVDRFSISFDSQVYLCLFINFSIDVHVFFDGAYSDYFDLSKVSLLVHWYWEAIVKGISFIQIIQSEVKLPKLCFYLCKWSSCNGHLTQAR